MMSIYVPASVDAPPLNTQLQLWSFSMCYHYVEFVTGNVNIVFKVLWNIMSRNCTFLRLLSFTIIPTFRLLVGMRISTKF